MANSVVRLPAEYFGNPDQGRPIFNGSVFIGNIDTDPEIEANRKTVTLLEEDGTEVPISPEGQPLLTGSGGYILYDGSTVTVLVDGAYSLKVLNKAGEQEYYFANVLDGAPLTIENAGEITVLKESHVATMVANTSLASGDLVKTVGYYNGWAAVLEPKGSGSYSIATLAEVQAVRGGGWTPDDLVDHTLANGNAAILERTDGVSFHQGGAKGDNSADDTLPLSAVIGLSGKVIASEGIFRITSEITLPLGLTMEGAGNQKTIILVIGAIRGLVFDQTLVECNITISDLSITGDEALSLDILTIKGGTVGVLNRVRVRSTTKSALRFDDNSINWTFNSCILESFGEYGMSASGFSSVHTWNNVQINGNTKVGIACFKYFGSGHVVFNGGNINGNSVIPSLWSGDAFQVMFDGTYVETMSGSVISLTGTEVATFLAMKNCLLSTSSSVIVDMDNGQAHSGLKFENMRFPSNSGAGNVFNFGSGVVDFEIKNVSLNTPSVLVAGFTTAQDSLTFPVQLAPKSNGYTATTAGLAPAGTEQITITVSTEFPATDYDFSFSIEVVGNGENAQSTDEMSYKLDSVTATQIIFTITRTGGASFQSATAYVNVTGTAK